MVDGFLFTEKKMQESKKKERKRKKRVISHGIDSQETIRKLLTLQTGCCYIRFLLRNQSIWLFLRTRISFLWVFSDPFLCFGLLTRNLWFSPKILLATGTHFTVDSMFRQNLYWTDKWLLSNILWKHLHRQWRAGYNLLWEHFRLGLQFKVFADWRKSIN